MENQPNRPNRHSHRYKDFDYSSHGAYFITCCVHKGECILGDVANHEMILNDAGRAIERYWYELPSHFRSIVLDEFRVMPNHVHLILWLQADVEQAIALGTANNMPTLGQVMRMFKSISAIEANRSLGRSGQFWQRDYWDRIVRDEIELENFRRYIRTNPVRWDKDQLHPNAPLNKFNRWESL